MRRRACAHHRWQRASSGKWLTAHLRAQGDVVVAIDHEVEITDADAVRQAVADSAPEVIYHLAALTHVGRSWNGPGEAFKVNALGTLNVLEAASVLNGAPAV